MGIGANDAVAGGHDALFGEQGVFDAHFSDIEEVRDVMGFRKLAAGSGLLGGFDVFVGHKVVEHDVDAVCICDIVESGFLEFADGDGGGDVIAENAVKFGHNELSGSDFILSGVGSQDFLCHGHGHKQMSPSFLDKSHGQPVAEHETRHCSYMYLGLSVLILGIVVIVCGMTSMI